MANLQPNQLTPAAPLSNADVFIAQQGSNPAAQTNAGAIAAFVTGSVAVYVVNVKNPIYGAKGDGSTNDYTAIQAALNAAGDFAQTNSATAICSFPRGIYKYTTALSIPPYVHIVGTGRNYAAIWQPSGCAAFIMDGSAGWRGGYVYGVTLEALTIDLQFASATIACNINLAYNINVRDVFSTNSPGTVATSWSISGCNDVVLDNTSICGLSTTISSNGIGLAISGSTVRLIAPDIEYFQTDLKTTGSNTWVEVYSLYTESSLLNYYHGITSGMVSFFGPDFGGGAGCAYLVDVEADNLAIYGPQMLAANYTIAAFKIGTSSTFSNVKVYGMPNNHGGGVLESTANLASIEFYPPLTPYVSRGTIDFFKSLTSGSATGLLSLKTSDIMVCSLIIYAYVDGSSGIGSAAARYDFIVNSQGVIPSIASSGASAASNSTYALALTSPTLSYGSSVYTFTLTATSTGSSGAGVAADVYGKLEFASYDVGATNAIKAL